MSEQALPAPEGGPATPRTTPAGFQTMIWRWWEGDWGLRGRVLSVLTLPTALLFKLGVRLRDLGFEAGLLQSRSASIPVVSVGNLAVGGTGKTPVAKEVLGRLLEAGAKPGLVARGYGRDELELHRRWHPDIPVSASPRRLEAVEAAAAAGAEIAVLDDGFQHRALARDVDLVLLAAEHPFPPKLLPRGPYREPLHALRRADLVLVTRRTASEEEASRLADAVRSAVPDVSVARVCLIPRDWVDLDGEPTDPPDGAILAVASVARPGDFAIMVERETGAPTELMAFPDHHDYTAADAAQIARRAGGRVVAVTEKDAVKLTAHRDLLAGARVLRLRPLFEQGEADLSRILADLVPKRS